MVEFSWHGLPARAEIFFTGWQPVSLKMALFGKPSARDEQKAEQYRLWLSAREPFAIASLVLGIFSLIEFGALFIFGIAGIVLGVLALRRLKSPVAERPLGHRLAWAGIITSALSIVIAIVIYLHIWR